MKSPLWVLILVFAFLSNTVKSQTKKEVQFSLDTLYKSHLKLEGDYRRLIDNWRLYDEFYQHVKVSMLDKSSVNKSIEEGQSLFDGVWNELSKRLKILEDSMTNTVDSLNQLNKKQQLLLMQNEVYLRMLNGKLNEAVYPNTAKELLGVWQLYLSPMQLAGDAYNSGLVSHNPFTVADSLQKYNIYQLEFLPDELAKIYFKDGRKQNCFYEVKNFSVGKPYEISCTKQQDKFNMTIHVSPMPSGLEVSYEIPLDTTQVIYFNGLMKH